MKIKNNNYNKYSNNPNFTHKAPSEAHLKAAREILAIKDLGKHITKDLDDIVKIEPPKYLVWAANLLKKAVPTVEKHVIKSKEDRINQMINAGNVLKELACMVVYPAQVLTNPDLPKEKRRFVGMYDFFVTCFSLGGALLYMTCGTKLSNRFAATLMRKFTDDPKMYPKAQRAVAGGGFVLGLLVQNLFFKRVLAPSLSPPLAAKARKMFEANDAKKEKLQAEKTAGTKDASTMIPPEHDAALSVLGKNSNLVDTFITQKSQRQDYLNSRQDKK